MKHHLIVSSLFTGGKDSDHGQKIIEAVNMNLNEVTVSESNSPGEAEELSRRALKAGAESILVAAGDSTINEVVNGFFEDDEMIIDRPHLGVIPTKEGTDLGKAVGMPDHLMEAVGRIGRNEPKPFDLGRVKLADGTTRYFANVASSGVYSSLDRDSRRASWLNVIDDDLSFNWSVFKNKLMHKRFPLLVSIPGGPQSLRWDANCVAVCNGTSFGDGITLDNDGDYADGHLDVIVVHDFKKAEYFKSLKQIREGELDGFEEGISNIRTRSVVLSCDETNREIPIDIDGKREGILPARFDVVPSAAMLF